MVSSFILLSLYSEICYSIIRFHLWFIYTQSVLTGLNVHMTGNPMADSPQNEDTDSPQNNDQTPNEIKTNDGK